MPNNKTPSYLKIPDKQRFGAIPDNKPRQGPLMPPDKNPNMDLGREDARIIRELNQRFPRLVPMPEELASKEHLVQVLENVTAVLNQAQEQLYNQTVKNNVNVELKGGKANLRIPPKPEPVKLDIPYFSNGAIDRNIEITPFLKGSFVEISKAEERLMNVSLEGLNMNQPRFLDDVSGNLDLDYPGLAKDDPRRKPLPSNKTGRIWNLGPGYRSNPYGLKVEDYFRNTEELAIFNAARMRGMLDPTVKGPTVPHVIPDEGYGGTPFAPDGWKYDKTTGKYRPYINPSKVGRAQRDAALNQWLKERSGNLYGGRLPLMPGADPTDLSRSQLTPEPGGYGSPEWLQNQVRYNVPPKTLEPELGPISGRIPNPAPQMQMVMENGKARLKQVPGAIKQAAPGIAKGAGAIGIDVASDLLIDNIQDPTLRQGTRTAKDLALTYAAPIASLLSMESSTKSREVQINAVDKLVDMGDGTVVIRSSAPTYDPKNPFDFRKWQMRFGDNTVETRMTIDEANALLKGKSQAPTIIEGSVVPIGFKSGKSLTKAQIEAGLQAEKEAIADAKRASANEPLAKQPQQLYETESVDYGFLSEDDKLLLQMASGEPARRTRKRPSPTITQTAPIAAEPAPQRLASAPLPQLREEPQISVSRGAARIPKAPLPNLTEYEKRRRALGPNATKAERDAVRDFGLQQWASNFPELAK